MDITALAGTYSIIGSNQDDSGNSYKGTLHISVDSAIRVSAKWLINGSQEQWGTGFYKKNVLVINFYYLDDEGNKYKGVVVYKCLSQDILEGFWSEKHGNPEFLGEERCFRIKENENLIIS